MSYASGIGSQQDAMSSITASEARPTIQPNSSHTVANEGAKPISQADRADQATLSSTVGLVAQALETPDTRSVRIGMLQQAIAAGNYSVPSLDVAEKIIQSLLGER
jgi:anti-sigma28 factor (negative regulator of flagellin synthesis)